MALPRYDLAAVRAQIPLLAHTIPLNNCSQAPLTTVTRAAADRFLDEWNRHGMDWDAWMAEVEASRRAFAALINAEPLRDRGDVVGLARRQRRRDGHRL